MTFASYLFPETGTYFHVTTSLSSAVNYFAAASRQKMYKYLLDHIVPEHVCICSRSLSGIVCNWSLNMLFS